MRCHQSSPENVRFRHAVPVSFVPVPTLLADCFAYDDDDPSVDFDGSSDAVGCVCRGGGLALVPMDKIDSIFWPFGLLG